MEKCIKIILIFAIIIEMIIICRNNKDYVIMHHIAPPISIKEIYEHHK